MNLGERQGAAVEADLVEHPAERIIPTLIAERHDVAHAIGLQRLRRRGGQRAIDIGQMVGTIDALQSASTDAETQKLQGTVTAQSAQLQALDQEVVNATSQAIVQDITNRNDQQKQQQAREEAIAADRHDALKKFGTMMVPDLNSDLRFGRKGGL